MTPDPVGAALREWAEEQLRDLNPEALFFEGPGDSDRAIVGIATKGPGPACVVYDEETLIATMTEAFRESSDDPEDDPGLAAREWFEFNTRGSYVGESTPWIALRMPRVMDITAAAEDRAG